jgi:hypothetical protein
MIEEVAIISSRRPARNRVSLPSYSKQYPARRKFTLNRAKKSGLRRSRYRRHMRSKIRIKL